MLPLHKFSIQKNLKISNKEIVITFFINCLLTNQICFLPLHYTTVIFVINDFSLMLLQTFSLNNSINFMRNITYIYLIYLPFHLQKRHFTQTNILRYETQIVQMPAKLPIATIFYLIRRIPFTKTTIYEEKHSQKRNIDRSNVG